MSSAFIYRWYESFEEDRVNVLLKGWPDVPCEQTNEIVLNTSATFVADDDDSHTSLFWSSSSSNIFQRSCLHMESELKITFLQMPCIRLTLWHNSLLGEVSKLYTLAPNPTLKRILKGRCSPTLQAIHTDIYNQGQCLSKDSFAHVFKSGKSVGTSAFVQVETTLNVYVIRSVDCV